MSEEMPPPMPVVEVPPAPTFQDRSTLLIVFGAGEILLGVLCGLLFLLGMFARMVMGDMMAEQMGQQQFLLSFAIYLLAAVFLVWMGIGSILAKRWARALMLIVSSIGLAVGSLCFVASCFIMPLVMYRTVAQDSDVPAEFASIMVVVMLGFMFCIYVFLPGIFVLFYRSPHVKATCEYKDPVVRWTDKCPLPVLAVSILCGYGGAWMLLMAPFMPIFPFLDTFITGPTAIALMAGIAVVLLLFSRGIYRLRSAAWWGYTAFITLGVVFSMATFPRLDWHEYYQAMGYSQQQMDMMDKTGMAEMMSSPGMMGLMVCTFAVYLGYLLYVRRYFKDAH
ncbi:MAG: hypothetical protein GY854_08905 [Deltaproteobacteria bacterium]|nr:hypothetical protein [Deltaproteobacteria bacterium]